QLERVEVFAAVLARGPLTEPQRLARGHDLVPRAGKAGHGAAREPYRFAGECGRVGRGLHQHHAVPTVRRHAYDRSLLHRRHVGPLSRLAAVDQPGGARIRSQEHRAVRVAGEERVERRLVARSEDAQFRAHAATIPERPVSCHALSAYNSTAPMRPVNAVVGLTLILAGCGHSAPPAAPESGSSQPFAGGSPRRLTFNLGDDRAPVWLPDGSGLLYSFQRLDRPDRDRCLGLLPPDGGRLERTLCDETPAADDSTNVLTEPAPSVDGRLAYLLVGSETI